mgnify:CR=1 FL=1
MLFRSIAKLVQEDPTLKVSTDPDTGQTILAGMGELHLEIIVDRMQREFSVGANVGKPQVAYRETIRQSAEYDYTHKKQTGGSGQYARCKLRIEAAPGTEFEFVNDIKGGNIPKEFIPAIEKGVVEALEHGILAGFPMSDVKVTVFDGAYHDVDSSEMAFKICASICIKEAARKAKPVLLEPVMRVEVVVPDDQLSLAIGRRGQNVRLASQLTSWQIDILTEQEESERRQKEFAERTALFMESLDVDETVAQLLASEGFASVEDVAYVALHDLADIEGFDEELAQALQSRAVGFIEERNAELDAQRRELGVTDDVAEVEGLTPAMLVKLGENEIKSLEDLAGCASDDLLGYVENKGTERVRVPGALDGFDLTADEVNDIIMKARVKAGWVKEEDLVKPDAGTSEEETPAT